MNNISPIQQTYPPSPLIRGDDNNYVFLAKAALNVISANYPSIPVLSPVNSIFDQNMEIAVKEFQRIFDLPETGVIDTATWFKIGDIHASVVRLAELSARGVLVGGGLEDTMEADGGVQVIPRVQMVQFFLNVLSAYYDSIPPLDIDGILGPQTRYGIIQFQKTMNLPPTGLLDEETWNELYRSVFGILKELPPAAIELPSFLYPDVLYSEGSERPGVFILQEVLAYISTLISEIPYVEPNGIFGPDTTAAVKAFQQYYGLDPNGIVDEETWNGLISLYRQLRFGDIPAP